MNRKKLSSNDLLMIVAVGLIAFGSLSILNVVIEQFFPSLRRVLTFVSGFIWPVTILVIGLLILTYTRKGGSFVNRHGLRLTRSTVNRKIAGVCGGLAEFLDKKVLHVRIAAIVLLAVTGIFPIGILYVMLWVVVPESGSGRR